MKPAILIIFFLFSFVFAQQIKIIEILDTNRFLLEDGRIICLANVQTPSKFDNDSTYAALVKKILNYTNKTLLHRRLHAEFMNAAHDSSCIPVHLYRKYTLQLLFYNKVFLEKGFGSLVATPASEHLPIYSKAAQEASGKNIGIYNPASLKQAYKKDYSLTLFMGNWKLARDARAQEAALQFISTRSHLRFVLDLGLLHRIEEGSGWCEAPWDPENHQPPPHYKVISVIGYGSLRLNFNFKYAGFGVGSFTMVKQRGYCEEGNFPYVFLPLFALRAGLMKRIFISCDFIALPVFPNIVALNYLFDRPHTKIVAGLSLLDKEHTTYLINLDYGFGGKYVVKLQGYLLDSQDRPFAFRMGIGKHFKTMKGD